MLFIVVDSKQKILWLNPLKGQSCSHGVLEKERGIQEKSQKDAY